MDPLVLLVREAAQNSWDARSEQDGPVQFTVEIIEIDNSAAARWRGLLVPGASGPLAESLLNACAPGEHLVLVRDRATRGLAGPLRDDRRVPSGTPRDFVRFVRNVGEASDRKYGGGTYGFGKGIFYTLSKAKVILVDTKCGHSPSDRRLIGAALSPAFYQTDRHYTGRHWWGRIVGGIPDPVLGTDADEVAGALELPGFLASETGTDIVIVGADLGLTEEDGEPRPRTAQEAGRSVASAILWHLWPKMGSTQRAAQMLFSVRVNGQEIALPNPSGVPSIAPFVHALDQLYAGQGSRYLRSVAPKVAGETSISLCPANPPEASSNQLVTTAAPFQSPYRHICRMRVPELVVDYFEGPPHPDPLIGYAGVFRSSKEADEHFAASEPPTHDGWIERGLSGATRGVVQGCRRFLRREIEQLLPETFVVGTAVGGLGSFATRLAHLASSRGLGVGGSSRADSTSSADSHRDADVQQGGGGVPDAGRRKWRPGLIRGPLLEVIHDDPLVVADVLVPVGIPVGVLTVRPVILLENGMTETDAPAGSKRPYMVGWWTVDEQGRVDPDSFVAGERVDLPMSRGGSRLRLACTYIEDLAVTFRLEWEGRS